MDDDIWRTARVRRLQDKLIEGRLIWYEPVRREEQC